ncbi:hypothetical protein D3C85_1138500 [compost metagenome]
MAGLNSIANRCTYHGFFPGDSAVYCLVAVDVIQQGNATFQQLISGTQGEGQRQTIRAVRAIGAATFGDKVGILHSVHGVFLLCLTRPGARLPYR